MTTAEWLGAPVDKLGCAVPIQQFVAQTSRTVMALQYAVAFREGCILQLQTTVLRGTADEAAWDDLTDETFKPGGGQTGLETDLRFGVRFPGGARATTVEHPFSGWAPATDQPQPPMLVEAGAESSSGTSSYRSSRSLWLWPLPPAGPFDFVAEWPSVGVPRTSVRLDGNAIVSAAELTLPYWRDEP